MSKSIYNCIQLSVWERDQHLLRTHMKITELTDREKIQIKQSDDEIQMKLSVVYVCQLSSCYLGDGFLCD